MIVAVVPAYNEAGALPRLVQRIAEVLRGLAQPFKIVVVDDGSSDGTAEAVERTVTDRGTLEVIRHQANRGLHGALDTGFRHVLATGSPADFVVTMDGDDTHPPDLIPQMLAQAERGSDLVIASRFQRGSEWHGKTWDRVLFSYGVSWLFRIVVPMRGVRDYTCGYRLYRSDLLRRAYDRFGDQFLAEASFACMPDILLKLRRLAPSISEAPLILRYDRKQGASKMAVSLTIRRTLLLLARHRFTWTS